MATRNPLNRLRRTDGTIHVSEQLIAAAHQSAEEVLRGLGASIQGLSNEEAQRRLDENGPNTAVEQPHFRYVRLFVRCLINPLVILLGVV